MSHTKAMLCTLGHEPRALTPPPDGLVDEVEVASTWVVVGCESRTAELWSTLPPLGGVCFYDWPSGQPDDRVLTLLTRDPSLQPPAPLDWATSWLPLDYLTHSMINRSPTPPDTATPSVPPHRAV